MNALVYEGPWQMPLRQVPAPVGGPGQVVIDVKAIGVCGSDVHGFQGTTGRRKPPIIMGHEFCGVVSSVGEGVSRCRPGDRVIGQPIQSCGSCEPCRAGRPNICLHRRVLGVDVNGAYADQVSVSEDMAYPMPSKLSWELGAMAEPLAVALHAVNRSPLQLLDTVAIVGAGAIGLLCLLAARLKGAGAIMITDVSPHRLDMARRLGANLAVNVTDHDPAAALQGLTQGRGADVVLEAVGLTSTVQQALTLVRAGGHITWVGNSQPIIELGMQQVVTREVTISGTYGFKAGAGQEFARSIALLATRRVDPSPLIEHTASLSQGPELVRALAAREFDLIKVILQP